MKRVLKIFALTILLMTVFSGCAEQKSEKISIGVMPDVNSVPFIVAAENELFKKQGVDVDIQLFISAVERDTALQTGKIDGCVSDILAAAFAIQSGFDVKITSVTDGDYVLLAGKNSNITDINGFKNKEIGLSTNTIIEYAVDSMLMGNGFEEEEIKKTGVPKIPVRLEMLENGQLYGACLPQPLAILAQSKGAAVIATSTQQGLAPSVMVFNNSVLNENKSDLERIYKAYNIAVEQLNNDAQSFKEIIIEKAKFPAEVKDNFSLPQYQKAVLPDEEDINNVLNWMDKKGLVKQKLEYKDMIEKGFF
jgi:NitT/TauT family transport system substrate-binding protein